MIWKNSSLCLCFKSAGLSVLVRPKANTILQRTEIIAWLACAMLFSWQKHFPIISNKRSVEMRTSSWSIQGHVNQDFKAVPATAEPWCNNHSASRRTFFPNVVLAICHKRSLTYETQRLSTSSYRFSTFINLSLRNRIYQIPSYQVSELHMLSISHVLSKHDKLLLSWKPQVFDRSATSETPLKTKLRGFSPQTNYTDRAIASCRPRGQRNGSPRPLSRFSRPVWITL
jgi:hypothetical protein